MKAIGKWVVLKHDSVELKSGIMMKGENVGVVVDCQCEPTLRGKRVVYSLIHDSHEHGEYFFVHHDHILGQLGVDD